MPDATRAQLEGIPDHDLLQLAPRAAIEPLLSVYVTLLPALPLTGMPVLPIDTSLALHELGSLLNPATPPEASAQHVRVLHPLCQTALRLVRADQNELRRLRANSPQIDPGLLDASTLHTR